jgi:hypothetical protein
VRHEPHTLRAETQSQRRRRAHFGCIHATMPDSEVEWTRVHGGVYGRSGPWDNGPARRPWSSRGPALVAPGPGMHSIGELGAQNSERRQIVFE